MKIHKATSLKYTHQYGSGSTAAKRLRNFKSPKIILHPATWDYSFSS